MAQDSTAKKVASLRAQLRDLDDQVRAKAAKGLAEIGPAAESAVGELVALIEKDKVPDVRIAAINGIRSIYFRGTNDPPEKTAILALARAMRKDGDTVVRWSACASLGAIGRGAKDGAADLLEAMKDKDDPRMQELARAALSRVVSPDCSDLTPVLVKMFKKGIEDPLTEFVVLCALGQIGAQEDVVVPLLIEVLKDKKPKHPDSAGGAARGLGFMGSKAKSSVPDLIDALESAVRSKADNARGFSSNLLRALERIGTDAREAIPVIQRIADDTKLSSITRGNARRALKAIMSK